MSNQEMTWEEWVEELATASCGEIDYWLVDEESAKANHPQLYEYYQMGYDVNDLVSERLMSYEGGDVMIWLDPDDVELTFHPPLNIPTIAEAFSELKIEVKDEYGSELSLNEYKFSKDGSLTLKIGYTSGIPDGKQFIKKELDRKIYELEHQVTHLKGKLESKDSEVAGLKQLLAGPKLQINNSGNLQIGNNNNMSSDRTINTGGGNYNESINGNYIQGNYINMSQDLTQAATQIQDLLEQLQKSGVTGDVAQEQVAKDLANHAQNNPTMKDTLVELAQSVGNATVIDVAKSTAKLAIRLLGIPLP